MHGDTIRTGPSRRGVIGSALLLLGGSAVLPAAFAATPRRMRPVVAFHADQLYLDRSGLAEPYAPPAGLRSLDGHDEAALRRLVYSL
jgi:hypothetical protein